MTLRMNSTDQPGVLQYAGRVETDPRPLIVRVWWMTLIWAASFATSYSMIMFVSLNVGRGGGGGPISRFDLWIGVAAISCATILFVLLLWHREASLSSKSVRLAVVAALLSQLSFLIPVGMQIQRNNRPLYAIQVSCEVLSLQVTWWLPLIGFLLSYKCINNIARDSDV